MKGLLFRNLTPKKCMLLEFLKRTSYSKHTVHEYATSSTNSINLSGIIPPIPTPFNKDESIAYDKLEENVQKWNKYKFKGYIVEGSNGEAVYLSPEERVGLIKRAKELKSPEKIIIGGSGCESTKATIDMCNKMSDAGADAVLVVTPSYFKSGMTDEALYNHYEQIANHSDAPVILYNVPKNTGIDMSVSLIAKLSTHKNIIGMKESGGDINKIGNILNVTNRQEFQVLAGSAGFLLSSLYLGCVGGVCGVANVLGKEVCDLYDLYTEGSQAKEEAVALQKNLIAPNDAVFGVPGLKAVLDAKGFYGGPPRSPLQKLSDENLQKILQIFKKAGYY